MKKMNLLRLVLLVAFVALLAAACAKKPAPPVAAVEDPVATEQPAADLSGVQEQPVIETPVEAVAPQPEVAPELQRIYFDFDQYTLNLQARDTLAGNAAYLKSHPELRVSIEGYCDERGSDEYNLALGERRALAARDFLISLGVAPKSLSTISYGEEKALEPGHREEAWAMNRRAEFNVTR